MTTIAYDGDTVAGDGLAVTGSNVTNRAFRKLRVVKDKIYGFSGTMAALEPVIKWHQAGADPRVAPKVEEEGWIILVLSLEHALIYSMEIPYAEEVFAPWALGTGRHYARAAMLLGKTARQAVEFAAENDIYTGGEIQCIEISPAAFRAPRAPKIKPAPVRDVELVRHAVPTGVVKAPAVNGGEGRQVSVWDDERKIRTIKWVRDPQ